MIRIELEKLILFGEIIGLSRSTTRAELIRQLGPHESGDPDIVGYGHIGFDVPHGLDQLYSVGISFPQYFRSRFFKPKDGIKYIEKWPDPRFDWEFGRLKIDSTVEDVLSAIPELAEWECSNDLFNAYGCGCSLQSPFSPSTIHFQSYCESEPMLIDNVHTFVRS